jgi:ABC-2 type transport system permease protein
MVETRMFNTQKYTAIFSLSFRQALKNYKALIGLSIFLMTCLIIFAHLWKVAATKIGAVSLNPQQLLWYIAFNEWVLISLPDIQEEMENDLRSGRLAYLLPRPLSYLGSSFMEALGAFCANLIALGIATFLFTWWQAGMLPFHFLGFGFIILFSLLAGILAIIFQMIIGLSAFWLQEVSPFYWVWEKLLFMCGGLILPLTVYPPWIQTLASFTPFSLILGARSALALDFNWSAILTLTGSFICWGLIGLISLLTIYRRGLRILNIEGG